jgi:hypothetical protein
MSNKGKAKPVVRVRPGINKPTSTDAQKVDTTRSSTVAMKASADWQSAADVQTSVASWNTTADAIEANAKTIAQLQDQLTAAVAKQRTLRQKWSVGKKQVVTSVDSFCENSLVKIQGFGLIAITHAPHPLLDAPIGIATSPGPLTGEASLTWTRGLAEGFLVQHATDTATPATYSPSIPCSKVKFTLTGASPPGSSVYFRLAAIDPHAPLGQSPWSAWVSATVK